MTPTLFALPIVLWSLVAAVELRRRQGDLSDLVKACAGLGGITALSWIMGALGGLLSIFGLVSLAAWAIFVGLPLLGLGAAAGARSRGLRVGSLLAAGAVVLVGVDAFLLEPANLQVDRISITSPHLSEPLTIALLADIQTDRVGAHEARAIAAVTAADPDLVLLAGDYVQLPPGPEFQQQAAALAALLAPLQPRLGMVAVQGDIDRAPWADNFAGTGVIVVERSQTLQLGPLAVTALTPGDSRSDQPPIPDLDGFHVVLGHSPDFAMTRPPADLLLAGHTHGGQVQLPLIGPLVTLSRVPRAWADGHTVLPWGGDLVVSRGIGLERADAPRLRFNCPPQVVIIDLVPADGVAAGDSG